MGPLRKALVSLKNSLSETEIKISHEDRTLD